MCICGIAGGTATDDVRVKCAHTSSKERLHCTLISDRGGGVSDLFRRIRRLIFSFSEAFSEDVF